MLLFLMSPGAEAGEGDDGEERWVSQRDALERVAEDVLGPAEPKDG